MPGAVHGDRRVAGRPARCRGRATSGNAESGAAGDRRLRAGRAGPVQRPRPAARPRLVGAQRRGVRVRHLVPAVGRRIEARARRPQRRRPARSRQDRPRHRDRTAHRASDRRRRSAFGDGDRSGVRQLDEASQALARRAADPGSGAPAQLRRGRVHARARSQGRARRPARRAVVVVGRAWRIGVAGRRRRRPRRVLRDAAARAGRVASRHGPAGRRAAARGPGCDSGRLRVRQRGRADGRRGRRRPNDRVDRRRGVGSLRAPARRRASPRRPGRHLRQRRDRVERQRRSGDRSDARSARRVGGGPTGVPDRAPHARPPRRRRPPVAADVARRRRRQARRAVARRARGRAGTGGARPAGPAHAADPGVGAGAFTPPAQRLPPLHRRPAPLGGGGQRLRTGRPRVATPTCSCSARCSTTSARATRATTPWPGWRSSAASATGSASASPTPTC